LWSSSRRHLEMVRNNSSRGIGIWFWSTDGCELETRYNEANLLDADELRVLVMTWHEFNHSEYYSDRSQLLYPHIMARKPIKLFDNLVTFIPPLNRTVKEMPCILHYPYRNCCKHHTSLLNDAWPCTDDSLCVIRPTSAYTDL
jgi:hypothetical protein